MKTLIHHGAAAMDSSGRRLKEATAIVFLLSGTAEKDPFWEFSGAIFFSSPLGITAPSLFPIGDTGIDVVSVSFSVSGTAAISVLLVGDIGTESGSASFSISGYTRFVLNNIGNSGTDSSFISFVNPIGTVTQ